MTLPILRAPRRLGKSDLAIGPIAYGLWRFAGSDVAAARAKIEAALDEGMTLIDTADIYGGDGASEALLGRVLAEAPALRERMVLATKGGIVPGLPYDSSADGLRRACEASLRRLGVDGVDLYQIHRPDWLAHPEEVAGVLAGLRQAGKAREIGVSNYTPAQVDALQRFLPFPLVSQQPEFSVLALEPLRDGVLDQCMERTLTPLAWSPLAGGALARDAEPGDERVRSVVGELDRLAREQGVDRSSVALAFVLAHPSGAVPIVGTQEIPRIRRCKEALGVALTRRDWYALVEASQGERLP